MITSVHNVRVRYVETDAMGIVHHSQYLNWMESARIQWLDELGLPYKTIEASGYRNPVLELAIAYRSPAYFDDRVSVLLTMKSPPRARFKIEYEIKRSDTLLATAYSVHGFINASGIPVRPPELFFSKVMAFFEV